ncbi:unnamed protein product [Effrenium voratum]|nr:unnamed protein product [Effrenium voratum]
MGLVQLLFDAWVGSTSYAFARRAGVFSAPRLEHITNATARKWAGRYLQVGELTAEYCAELEKGFKEVRGPSGAGSLSSQAGRGWGDCPIATSKAMTAVWQVVTFKVLWQDGPIGLKGGMFVLGAVQATIRRTQPLADLGNDGMKARMTSTREPRLQCPQNAMVRAVCDLYAILQLPKDFSEPELRRAYRRQALLRHPDKGGSAVDFQRRAIFELMAALSRLQLRVIAVADILYSQETIANMSQKLRRQFLEYLDGRHSTKESPERSAEPNVAEEGSDSDSDGQLMLEDLEPKPKNCRRTPVQAQRGLRRISLQTYSVDCSLFNTMFVTKAASLETSLDYHILLTQVRARSRRHGSNSAGETSELVQKAVEEVLAEKNLLAEDMGLKAFVFLQWGRYDNFPSIRSPVLQVEEALQWRTRLLSAAKWEDFRTVWIDLLTHPKFKIKETMDHTQAAAFVDSHEENVTRSNC